MLLKRESDSFRYYWKVYEIYLQRLNKENLLDFNDMINDAVIKLRKGAYIHNYKYIFVDEYQDTSHTRYNLLKEMQNRTGAKVIVVGMIGNQFMVLLVVI